MPEPYFVTEVERQLAERRKWWAPLRLLLLAIIAVILFLAISALFLFTRNGSPRYDNVVEHFKYGSIGSEVDSGIPYRVWRALPKLFPSEFEGRNDYSAFGFLYEKDARGKQRDLPIGVSRRDVHGVEMVWLNCAVCIRPRTAPGNRRRSCQPCPQQFSSSVSFASCSPRQPTNAWRPIR